MIATYNELPEHLRDLLKTLPPKLKIPLACDIRQVSRATLYERIGNGCIAAFKDGNTTLVDTLSILIDMANLPPADIAPQKSKLAAANAPRAAEVDPTTPRKRGRPRKEAQRLQGAGAR